MTLKDFIQEYGATKLAKLLVVDDAAVSAWKHLGVLPRPTYMRKIHLLSKGRVSYKTMVETAARAQSRNKKSSKK